MKLPNISWSWDEQRTTATPFSDGENVGEVSGVSVQYNGNGHDLYLGDARVSLPSTRDQALRDATPYVVGYLIGNSNARTFSLPIYEEGSDGNEIDRTSVELQDKQIQRLLEAVVRENELGEKNAIAEVAMELSIIEDEREPDEE